MNKPSAESAERRRRANLKLSELRAFREEQREKRSKPTVTVVSGDPAADYKRPFKIGGSQ